MGGQVGRQFSLKLKGLVKEHKESSAVKRAGRARQGWVGHAAGGAML